MKYGLSTQQLQTLHDVFTQYPSIEHVILFGSRAIDTYKEASDVDLALKGTIDTSLIAHLKDTLEEDTDIPFFFDILAYDDIQNKTLRDHIKQKGVILYRKGWRKVKLGEIVKLNPKTTLPKGTIGKKVAMETIAPWTKKISSYTINPYKGGAKFINGDTLMARITPSLENGKTAFVDFLDREEVGFGSTELIVLRGKKNTSDNNYIYYLSISPKFRNIAIQSMTGSSGRQRVHNKVLEEFQFLCPPLPEQKTIAKVLSTLDDKIDLLHTQNKTLETITQTLFRKWFVEEANEEWEKKPLSAVANFLNGLACQKYPPKNEVDKLSILKIKELTNGFTKNSASASTDVDKKYFIKNGDIIFSWSASLIVKIWDGKDCILNQHLFKVTSDNFPKWYYYLWCKHHLNKFVAIASSKATTMGHIRKHDLDLAMVLVPSKKELTQMHATFSPLFKKLLSNTQQIRTLTSLRNTLLPKLMSGQIKVKSS